MAGGNDTRRGPQSRRPRRERGGRGCADCPRRGLAEGPVRRNGVGSGVHGRGEKVILGIAFRRSGFPASLGRLLDVSCVLFPSGWKAGRRSKGGFIMSRMLAVAFLGLPLTVVATSDDSKSKIDPKPQWQRLLTDADARKAADLEKRIGELEAADKYAETIRLIEELLALRTRLQGADHW